MVACCPQPRISTHIISGLTGGQPTGHIGLPALLSLENGTLAGDYHTYRCAFKSQHLVDIVAP